MECAPDDNDEGGFGVIAHGRWTEQNGITSDRRSISERTSQVVSLERW